MICFIWREKYPMKQIAEFFKNTGDFFNTYVIDTLKEIGFKDIIDILLLAVILFFIYRLITD